MKVNPTSVKIYDIQGKLVKTIENIEVSSKTSIEISDLQKGNYVLIISTTTGTSTGHFIKQ